MDDSEPDEVSLCTESKLGAKRQQMTNCRGASLSRVGSIEGRSTAKCVRVHVCVCACASSVRVYVRVRVCACGCKMLSDRADIVAPQKVQTHSRANSHLALSV